MSFQSDSLVPLSPGTNEVSRYQRRSPEDWQSIMDAQMHSGLSQRAFCEREGIAVSSFAAWRRRVKSVETTASFVALSPAPVGEWQVELQVNENMILRIR